MDVSLKLRLDYNDRGARRAKKDLKELDRAADRLDGSGAGKLGQDLERLNASAKRAASSLSQPAEKLRALNSVRTDRVEGEVDSLKRAADSLERSLSRPVRELQNLNRQNTNRAQKEVEELGRAAAKASQKLKGLDQTKFTRFNSEVDKATGKVDRLQNRLRDTTALHAPAGRLTGVMGSLEGTAGRAFGALLAFASVDNIVRGLNELEDRFNAVDQAAARVALTAEMRDPVSVERIKAENEALSGRFGKSVSEVNDARNVYAAANYTLDQQSALLRPTLKTVNATGSAPDTIANAVTAAINNLGLTEDQIPEFLDQIVKGGKEGEFEIEAMAKYFPELGALYSASGRTGLDASAELIALAQVVRKGAGMESGAATNLQNFLSKMAAPETVKNFKDKGVDLRDIAGKAQKAGTPYILSLLDEVERLTGGDEFEVGELFGDMQAKSALRPLLKNRDLYNSAFDAVRNKSKGVVQADSDFIDQTPQAEADRRKQALNKTGREAGSVWGVMKNRLVDEFLGWVNPSYRRQEATLDRELTLKDTNLEHLELEIQELQGRLNDRPENRFGLPDTSRVPLQMRLQELQRQLNDARKLKGVGSSHPTDLDGASKPMVPRAKPDLSRLVPDDQAFLDAGGQAGSKFADALSQEAEKAGAIADSLKARFSFTATPTINPSFSAATPTTLQRTSVNRSARPSPGGPLKVQQTFNQVRDPERTARVAVRKQNKAIQRARARALHDTGDFV